MLSVMIKNILRMFLLLPCHRFRDTIGIMEKYIGQAWRDRVLVNGPDLERHNGLKLTKN
ncbi:hypothetical protein EP10_002927 [Geobacillus icigianus]|uniref:Uncharacterized protein n=1 Tax=Geobacillus icigianus TaxID=1430331 RepID=A0ABU6BJT3_9BACL|nr:hypothetical protein [Geobacillus icigianus]